MPPLVGQDRHSGEEQPHGHCECDDSLHDRLLLPRVLAPACGGFTSDLRAVHLTLIVLEESTTHDTFNATEQTEVEQFIAGGGNLFVTGAEIAWDLDQQNNGRTFYENTLKGNYVADDANTYNITAAAGGIFDGLPNFSFSNGAAFSSLDSQVYNVDFPDVISPQAGAQLALNYSGGAGGGAAIQVAGTGGNGSIVMFGFPFETITRSVPSSGCSGSLKNFTEIEAIGSSS